MKSDSQLLLEVERCSELKQVLISSSCVKRRQFARRNVD